MCVIYEFNIFGIRTWVETSSLGERITVGVKSQDSVLENVRWEMSLKILTSLPSQPFGKITVVHYAHNLFLDIAKFTGIVPAFFLFVWCVGSIIKYFRYVKLSLNEWDICLLSISLCMMIVFFLEPVLEGLPIAFSAFCYLCGIMKGRTKLYLKGNM